MPPTEMLQRAAQVLRDGGLVVFPTETVYCIGADVLNRTAVEKLYQAKNRPKFDPLIVHIADMDQVEQMAGTVPAAARTLMEQFWPGALTVVLPRRDVFHDQGAGGLPGVALRFPSNPLAQEFIRLAGRPVAAAAANSFGNVSPTTLAHARADLGSAIGAEIDGGECSIGIETTIISFLDSPPVVLRPGAVPLEGIEAAIGPVALPRPDHTLFFPGMTDHRYTPHTVTLDMDQIAQLPRDMQIGLICLQAPADSAPFEAVEVLSPSGDLAEAARNLFAAMRRLDAMDLDLIVAQRVPDTGLGKVINDRLGRACY